MYFINPDTGWVLGDKGKVLKTTNGGRNWTVTKLTVGSNTPNFGPCVFIDDSTGWIAGYNFNGIAPLFKTTDAGNSWIRITNINPKVYYISKIHFFDKNNGWLLSGNIVLKTSDGGNSWISKELPGTLNSLYFSSKDAGWAIGGKGTDNMKTCIIGSKDGGSSWNEIQVNSQGSLLDLEFSDGIGWAVGENGLIYKSTDNGESWILLSEEMYSLNSIHFSDDNNGWAVGDSGVILHTTDSGLNWHKQYQSNNMILNSVFAVDKQNAFSVGGILNISNPGYSSNSVVMQTSDAGQNWTKRIYDSFETFNTVFFVNNTAGWIGAPDGTLLKTTDKGAAWEVKKIKSSSAIGFVKKIQFINESIGWISASIGSLFKTTDKGESWLKQFIDSSFYLNSFYFANSKVGWAVGDHYLGKNLFKTTDGGNNWTNISIGTAHNSTSVYFVNESTGWILGYIPNEQKSFILKSTDGGENWAAQNLTSSNLFNAFFFFDESKGFIAGKGILITNTGGTTSFVKEENSIIPETIQLYQNYPNPFNPSTTIRYTINKPGHVSVKIYDILGKLVKVLIDEWQNEGEYKINWYAGDIASGLYFCRLTSGNYSEIKKITIIK